jgi:hypothetical protein
MMHRKSSRPSRRARGMCLGLTVAALAIAAGSPSTVAEQSSREQETASQPRVFLLDAESLLETRQRVREGDPALAPAIEKLRDEADKALKSGPYSVMDKDIVPPSGDKHDYYSFGPYWWPDPSKPDGLPYIRRDGEVNPKRDTGDRRPMGRMSGAVETLALAYFFTGHEPYAEHAARLLRVWFLDEATRMNPHLEYGQAIPGRTEGRGIGIIDTAGLPRLVDAVGLLQGSEHWMPGDQQGMQRWFGEYLTWLQESSHGRDEDATKNNHATWYDVQVASFALFAGQEDLAREVLERAGERRIRTQIETDGRQPHELARTKSFDYSTMNLRGMFEMATLAEHVDVDLWNYESDDGRSIRQALDWLLPFATGEREWKHEQLKGLDPQRLTPLLRRAAIVWQDPDYEQAARKTGSDAADRMHLLWPERY